MACLGTLQAENFRLGITGTLEMDGNPFAVSSYEEASAMKSFFPGFYWEVLMGHLGLGMTCLGRFTSHESSVAGDPKIWDFEWIGSMELRFHFTKRSFFDPFAEVGVGCAGWIDFANSASSSMEYEARVKGLSLFGSVGGGLVLRLDALHVGIRVLYRFFNEALPATPFEATPLSSFESTLFAGVTL
jgi:hypothetical protein